jgi:SAM-dependent methyltransferase
MNMLSLPNEAEKHHTSHATGPILTWWWYMDPVSSLNEYYTNPQVIKAYSTVGLFPAEEKMIDKYFRAGSSILDVGCGAGRTTIPLAQKGYQVVGVDLIPKMIAAARQQASAHQVKVDFIVMDVVTMQFPKQSFQNVFFAYNGFEQIPGKKNRIQALQKIFDVLAPGGCFILTTRSGLGFGRRTFGWVVMALTYPYQYFGSRAERPIEFGDKLWGGFYCHYLNPFYVKKLSQRIGFHLLDFNSEKNVSKGRSGNFLTNFSSDRMLFYIFRKN